MAKAELGILLHDLRGKAGNAVFVAGRNGAVVRTRVIPRNPCTAAQKAVRASLAKAAAAYRSLTATQQAQWVAYAAGITRTRAGSGKSYHPTPISVFAALASKFLQVNPTGTIPTTPPTASFGGDTITVTAAAGTGKITFTATAANAANVKTELLLQPLVSKYCTPQAHQYRSKAFVAFTGASSGLSADVTVAPGCYAAAYRFVSTVTGQETQIVPISIQTVSLAVTLADDEAMPQAA